MEKKPSPKTKAGVLFQPSILRGELLVSGRVVRNGVKWGPQSPLQMAENKWFLLTGVISSRKKSVEFLGPYENNW